jgi:membrane protease subunit (stomatin/prohibitin family)
VNPNHGSNHYQRRGGFFGSLLNMFVSGSNSGKPNYQYTQNNSNKPLEYGNPGMIICSKCQNHVPYGSKFCLECGEKVYAILSCKQCGEQMPGSAKFCLKCGKSLIG